MVDEIQASDRLEEFTYIAETEGVVVQVEPMYLEDAPEDEDLEGNHLWAYCVRIQNRTEQTMQLRARYWRVLDSLGTVSEMHGAGVVGEQPVIHPNELYEYDSLIALETSSGFMGGYYDMQLADGTKLQITIPTFTLDRPGEIHSLN
ncbi:MAG: Co2+/Mg2+ efflux protein ApaG [Alphaproteobacteria bacterium]|nr:Co2+/Mg2+ efflux protein ApaG [Alphaproteobacteria bacterium]